MICGFLFSSILAYQPADQEKKSGLDKKCSLPHTAEASNVGPGRKFTWGGQGGLPWMVRSVKGE